ncbi:FAD/NAD(P)-binding protein [Rhodococcus sp. W8901]|nr:FAD/NAD(P)-binding protein [Rhodococcus sp. W8901]
MLAAAARKGVVEHVGARPGGCRDRDARSRGRAGLVVVAAPAGVGLRCRRGRHHRGVGGRRRGPARRGRGRSGVRLCGVAGAVRRPPRPAPGHPRAPVGSLCEPRWLAVTATVVPTAHRVLRRTVETHDSVTLELGPVHAPLPGFRPGQFMMLCAPGVGEIPISSCGDPTARHGVSVHTIRRVGAVSAALHDADVGRMIGVRGPFGTGWNLAAATGRDLLIIAGGVGFAAVRAPVLAVRADRAAYRAVTVVVGARSPEEILYRGELDDWRAAGIDVLVTVDRPAPGWSGPIGFVTEVLGRLDLDPARTRAILCGPEAMMRFSVRVLLGKGVAPDAVEVSLERNMQCGIGVCGHCQLGELLLCRDGPVVDYASAAPLMHTREL